MPSTKIDFAGHSGEILSARLELPTGEIQTTAIFAHCFTCSKDIPAARRISQRLAANGIAVLRFDFTGLGLSGGEFKNTDFSSNVLDLKKAAQHLSEDYPAPSLLVGHSLGGAAVLRAAKEIDSVKAVAVIGAPAEPEHVLQNFGSSLEKIESDGEAEVNLGGRAITIKKSFVDDVSSTDLSQSIGTLNRALLVLHSPIDTIVGIENAAQIFAAAKHPKSFVTLDQADHLISKSEDADYAAGVITAWAKRYLEIAETPINSAAPEGVVRSSEIDPSGFLQDIQAGSSHHTLADEPISYGGTNLGMTPFNFLSAGLAACTSMTIRMYARRKGWDLKDISVDVHHNKIHAQECKNCETQSGKVDQFTRVVNISGDLDDAQRARLLEIADKCPVHKTLESEISIKTKLG